MNAPPACTYLLALAGFAISTIARAQTDTETDRASRNVGDDLLGTLHHMGAGAAAQVTHWDSLALLGLTVGGTAVLVATEDYWQEDVERADLFGKDARYIADVSGIVLTFPSVPFGVYVWGRVAENEKLTQFATETAATQGIALLETLLISQIPIHERPVVQRGEITDEEQPFFNRFFRGASSFPSGHITGTSVLAFKGWEWFGWTVGLPAALATAFIGYARVEDGEHFTSDIVSGMALSGLASLGTSRTRHIWKAYLPSDVLIVPTASESGMGVGVVGAF